MYPGQPELEYWDGPHMRVEYIPSLLWKVGTASFRWAPTPTIEHHFENLPFGGKAERSFPNYDHAFDEALKAVEASIKGQEAIDEYNKNSLLL